MLAANIVACDFADVGYEIEPVMVKHPYDTCFGRDVVAPFYFQPETKATLKHINKLLGTNFDDATVLDALTRMGSKVSSKKIADDDIKVNIEIIIKMSDYTNPIQENTNNGECHVRKNNWI